MYAKLSDTLLTSSILDFGFGPVAIWAMILASKDKYGITHQNPRSLTKLFGGAVARDEVDAAWEVLISPDKDTTTQLEDGRRLLPLPDGGHMVVTHSIHEHQHNPDVKKEQIAEASRRYRTKKKAIDGKCATNGCGRQWEFLVEGVDHLCVEHFDPACGMAYVTRKKAKKCKECKQFPELDLDENDLCAKCAEGASDVPF